MAHGHPDYGTSTLEGMMHVSTDMAELAARLGSLVGIDRSGNVVGLNDFDDSIASVYGDTLGAGSSVAYDNTVAFRGKGSAKLVGGAVPSGFASIQKKFMGRWTGKVGIATWFSITDEPVYFHLQLIVQTPDNRKIGILRLDFSDHTVRYIDSDSAYQTIHTFASDNYSWVHTWHYWKLVLDFDNLTYHRAIVNGEEYDLSAYTLPSTGGVILNQIYYAVSIYTEDGNGGTVNVDNVVLTINER